MSRKVTFEMVNNECKKSNFDLILIGASTGGPEALVSILSDLPASFKCPIIIIQHMPANMLSYFIKQLNRDAKLEFFKARNGEYLEAGKVLVAPGNLNLEVCSTGGRLSVNHKECILSKEFCPSVDALFKSAANLVNLKVLGLVLTGIGSDGTLGVKALKKEGAEIWVQEEKNCTAFGMPKAAIETGVVDRILSLNDMRVELGRI